MMEGGGWYHVPMLLGFGEVKLYIDYEGWGGGVCERSSSTLSNGQFIQKHRGGKSNICTVD